MSVLILGHVVYAFSSININVDDEHMDVSKCNISNHVQDIVLVI